MTNIFFPSLQDDFEFKCSVCGKYWKVANLRMASTKVANHKMNSKNNSTGISRDS